MWNKPWDLKEGFIVCSGLVATGLLLQLTVGPIIWSIFAWPVNIITLGVLIVLGIIGAALHNKLYILRFATTYQAAIPAIVTAVLLTVIMGLTRQSAKPVSDDPLGLTNALTNWMFVLVYFWMAVILALTMARKILHFQRKVLPALLSHTGLLLVLVCGTLGSADMQRLKMYCEYDKPEWRALDAENKVHELPLAVQLDSFIIDEYPPKLTLVDNKTMQAVMINGKPLSVLIDDKFTDARFGDWKVTVTEVLDFASPTMTADTTVYEAWPVKGAACAVAVKAEKVSGRKDKTQHSAPIVRTGWVSCGSYSFPSQMLTLDSLYSIGMSQREPQRYASKIQILTQDGDNVETVVEVNKPYTIKGWNIYQYSYNEQMGKWSTYSVFELVSDPWLPVVYIGIGMLALGALGMFFTPRKKEDENVG